VGHAISPAAPPHRFDPLAPYAAFGWLPDGIPLAADGPQSLPTAVTLLAGTLATGQFNLVVWAPGTCNLSAAQALASLQRHGQPQLNCMQNPSAGALAYLTRPSPPVAGHPGFWARYDELAWEYAPHAWAELQPYRRGTAVPDATVLKVAAHVRYGAAAPSVRFPYQFTGLPNSWRVTSATWRARGGVMQGMSLAAGYLGQVSVRPGRGGCWFDRGASQRITVGGAKAVFTLFRLNGTHSYQGLCVPETDGLSVDFLMFRAPGGYGFPLGGVTGVFLHHLRLLGPDPAHWTTRPLG
jgi:hypothetical protein